jgi:hypothetical protein
MRDVLVLVITVAFFALCVAYVRWCDHIIGPDPDGLRDDDLEDDVEVDTQVAVALDHADADRGAVRT